MSADDLGSNRRRHARSEVLATAIVFTETDLLGTYLVQDLSAGGACLVGEVALEAGAAVNVYLQFPGKEPLHASARVVRQFEGGPKRGRFAIMFADLRADQEDVIHEAIVGSLERQRARRSATVLVVDHDGGAREALERDLRALGHEAVSVATPLEAVAYLERPETRIATVVVDVSLAAGSGLDVLDFVGEHHPHVRRVVMSGEQRPFRLDLALRSGRAHKVLRKPWDRTQLAAAFEPRPAGTDAEGPEAAAPEPE